VSHLTPDVLAAWMDGTLSGGERSAAEAHASDCAHCQALLATMARIEPAATRAPWWSMSGIRWLVPAAAAVMVAIIVSLLPFVQRGHDTAVPEPKAQPVAGTRSAEPTAEKPSAEPSTRTEAPATLDELRAERQAKPEDTKALRQKSKDFARSTAENAPSKVGALQDRADKRDANAVVPESAAASAASALPAAPPAAGASQTATPSNAAAPAQPEPATAPSVQESVRVTSDDALKKTAPRAAMSAAGVRPLEVVSPERSYRWRAVSPGSILYSMDGGVSWRPTSASAGMAMHAGSAPARNVCWLVGESGTVLLTTDGQNWRVRPFPERVDLTDVQATDARTATVTTANRRRFATTDGGATWSPLQEN
jgi:putative zinc finger protein